MVNNIYLLGIDLGAQSAKVALVSPRGDMRGLGHFSYEIQHPYPAWAEEDPEVWWKAFLKGLDSAFHGSTVKKNEIAGIGISNMCPSLVAMDREGNPLRPAILFLDRRSVTQSEQVIGRLGLDEIFQRVGNRMAPGTFSVTSMLWIKENEPEVYRKAYALGHANTFLASRLTDNFAMDWTNASFTGVFDTGGSRDWHVDMVKELGLSRDKLPPVLPSPTLIGRVSSRASRVTGLPSGIPVAIGGADTACAAFGSAITELGEAFETSGTSDVISVCCDQPRFDIRLMNRCHVVPDRWLLMGAMVAPGAAYQWFREQFCRCEQEVGEKSNMRTYEVMDLQAEKSPPGAHGIVFLPYLAGERSPIWDPYARGLFFGFSLSSARGDFIRAMLEGTAYGLRQNIDIVEKDLGFSISGFHTVGGGARSWIWNQIKADVMAKVVRPMSIRETAVLGAAMLGGIVSGVYKDYKDAVKQAAASPSQAHTPNPQLYPLYTHLFEVYKGLYMDVKERFRQLHQALETP
jgi:xylulokinase